MARKHTTNGEYTSPEVRFERSDIEASGVAFWGTVLAGVTLAAVVISFWVGSYLSRSESARKATTLPPAAVDKDEGLPPIPLEGIEDLKVRRRAALFPPRAQEYLEPQEKQLADGDK